MPHRRIASVARTSLSPAFLARVGYSLLGLCIFNALEIRYARMVLWRTATWGLGDSVIAKTSTGEFHIVSPHVDCIITPECTYLDLMALCSPFLWVSGQSLALNCARLIVVNIGIASMNIGRLTASIFLVNHGMDWWLAHEFLDTCIYYPALMFAVLFQLRALGNKCRNA